MALSDYVKTLQKVGGLLHLEFLSHHHGPVCVDGCNSPVRDHNCQMLQ